MSEKLRFESREVQLRVQMRSQAQLGNELVVLIGAASVGYSITSITWPRVELTVTLTRPLS